MAIRVRTDIPFGNACDITTTRQGDVDVVTFTPDPRNGTEKMWFCLRVERDADDAPRLKLVLKHVGTMLAGLMPGVIDAIRPVARRDGDDWDRLGPAEALVQPDGRQWATWTTPSPQRTLDIALCYPYGPDEVERLLAECHGYWRCDTVGVSQGGRPIHRLSNRYGRDGDSAPGFYLIARQHSGETPGSWVLDGMLRRLAALGDGAPLAWCVPLADIDGVARGDYGKDAFPHDLNRAWGEPPMRHETLVIGRDMRLWASRGQPTLVLDFHAPGLGEGTGIYAFVSPHGQPEAAHRHARSWAESCRGALGDLAAENFLRQPTHAGRWRGETDLAGFAGSTLDVPTLVLECSYARSGGRVLSREDYRTAGERLAENIAANTRNFNNPCLA